MPQTGQRFIPYKQFETFSMIPNALLEFPGLSPGAKLMWGRLAQYAGENGECFPGLARLATDLATSKDTARDRIRELERKGFIGRDGSPGQTNNYHFLLHPALAHALKNPHHVNADAPAGDGGFSTPPLEDSPPKEIREIENRKAKDSSRVLTQRTLRYIDLKADHALAHGEVQSTRAAYRGGLVKRAQEGTLDISGLEALEEWKAGQTAQAEPAKKARKPREEKPWAGLDYHPMAPKRENRGWRAGREDTARVIEAIVDLIELKGSGVSTAELWWEVGKRRLPVGRSNNFVTFRKYHAKVIEGELARRAAQRPAIGGADASPAEVQTAIRENPSQLKAEDWLFEEAGKMLNRGVSTSNLPATLQEQCRRDSYPDWEYVSAWVADNMERIDAEWGVPY